MNQQKLNEFDYRHQLIAMLIQLAAIDGVVVREETHYIWALAKHIKIRKEDFTFLALNADDLAQPMPESHPEKLICFFHVFKLIIADNKVDELELDYFFQVGNLLGLNPEKVEKVGATWFKFADSNVSIDVFLTFWNQC